MVLHLVQSSGRRSKRTSSKGTCIKETESASAEMLCRIESIEEVMQDDCIEILTVEQEKQALNPIVSS